MTTASARVLHPDLRVTLYKLVKRTMVNGTLPASERFQQSGRQVDLTPYFSDMGALHTAKSIRSPAGAFHFTFSDRPHMAAGVLETLYGLIEPMDAIEIRISHNQRATQPPVVMRGFVSHVSRSIGMDGQGNPTRIVNVEGHDYGKLWQMLQILTRPWHSLGQTWISSFPLFERFGIGLQTTLSANDFIAAVVEQVLNPHLAGMLPDDWPMPKAITPVCTVTEGQTSVTGPQNAEGPLFNIMAQFGDVTSGFNELFIEDREDSVAAIYRPSPARDLDGQPIQAAQGEPAPAPTLPAADIVSLNLARSDQDVANYFWVEDPRFELVREFSLQFAAATSAQRETVFMTTHPNNNPAIYGLRPMVVASQMGESPTFQGGQPAAAQQERNQAALRWLDERRRILGATNRDNAILESGSARIAGNERIRPGQHITLGEGALAALYYVEAVQHDYVPYQGYFTTLSLARGQGFARRLQAGSAVSPYLIELGAAAPGGTAPQRTAPTVRQT